jgi:hypothetical protein
VVHDTFRRAIAALALLLPLTAWTGGTARAESAAAAAQTDDDAALQLAEPDFRLVNVPTTLRLPVHGGNFALTHRFNGNLRRGSFADQASDLFGLDEGAVIGFEFRYGVLPHVQAVVYRAALDKTVQFQGKYDVVRQNDRRPLSFSAMASVEGADNFHTRYSPSLGAVVARSFVDVAAVYAAPTWVHNSAALTGISRDTFVVGLGARIRIRPTVYVVGEISPRLAGYKPGESELAFAIEKRAGGHLFQLNVGNANGTTTGQMARGGFEHTLYLGFNLSRKFF